MLVSFQQNKNINKKDTGKKKEEIIMKLYYVRTSGFDMIVSDHGDYCHVLDNIPWAGFGDQDEIRAKALEILESIDDDSVGQIPEETAEEIIENSDGEILAEITW